jgi:hypothetical protein
VRLIEAAIQKRNSEKQGAVGMPVASDVSEEVEVGQTTINLYHMLEMGISEPATGDACDLAPGQDRAAQRGAVDHLTSNDSG